MFREEWLRWAASKRQNSETTQANYRREWNALAGYVEKRGLEVAGLTPQQIRQWMQYRSGSEKTAARRWSALNSFFTYLVIKNVRPDNPMSLVPRPKIPQGTPRPVLDVEEKIKLLSEPFRSIAVLVHETGMATQEMLSIDLGVDVGDDQVWVRGRQDRDRPVVLTSKAQSALRRLRQSLPNGRWFKARTIQKHLREEAGLTLRGLRNTVAAELAANGSDIGTVQGVLGHRSASSTRTYMTAFAKPVGSGELRKALERRGKLKPADLETSGAGS
jgi:site-specific recombinase XerD